MHEAVHLDHLNELKIMKVCFRYAELMSKILKIIFQNLIQSADQETENQFWAKVVKKLYIGNESKLQLAEHVMDSVVEFYSILKNDQTRDGIVGRKLVLQALTGSQVRGSGEWYLLADIIGARRKTMDQENLNRIKLEEQQKLLPFCKMLKRKSARGARFISEKEKMDVTVDFYEDDEVSDILKGHNNCYREILISEEGIKSVFNRSKRVLKLNSCDLLEVARKKVGFKFCLRSLLYLRPPWVLLPREAHSLTCLCDRCQNIKNCLRSICNRINQIKQHGALADKAVALKCDLSTSVSEFVSKVLHPKPDGSDWHSSECYHQTCRSTTESPCGSAKLDKFFEKLLERFGDNKLPLVQHQRVQYVKTDGSMGHKFDQVQTELSFCEIVDILRERMFGTKIHRQPYIMHRLKMLLASKMRKEIHQNITETDIVAYSDFSKELELTGQEQCKSELYGASHQTIQLVGQVYELRVLPPGPPLNLVFHQTDQKLSFEAPKMNGGSRIQLYEVHVMYESIWYHLLSVDVKYLSHDPSIPVNMFGRLGGLYNVRVYSRNLSCVGEFAEIVVELSGDLPFCPKLKHHIPPDHYDRKNLTCLSEYFYFSDHSDAPKNWKTITKCKQISLHDLQSRLSRDIKRCITVTDTGGENSGSTVSNI